MSVAAMESPVVGRSRDAERAVSAMFRNVLMRSRGSRDSTRRSRNPSRHGSRSRAAGRVPSFRTGVDVVAVNVTATDRSRRYVTDLSREDFLVLEDGREQQVTYFRKTGISLALALLIDTSASMAQSLPLAQEAAIGFVRALGVSDVASIVDFDNRVRVRQGFTSDHDALERAVRLT